MLPSSQLRPDRVLPEDVFERRGVYGLRPGCELWRGCMASRNLRTYGFLTLLNQISTVYSLNLCLLSCILCCHYRRKTGTSCFNQWWDYDTKSPVSEVAGKTVIQSVNEISWVCTTKAFTRMVIEQVKILKSTSPSVQSLSIFLTCWSRFYLTWTRYWLFF